MAITQKIFVRISSNLLHSIRTSICIRKCNKNFWCLKCDWKIIVIMLISLLVLMDLVNLLLVLFKYVVVYVVVVVIVVV